MAIIRYKYTITEEYCAKPEEVAIPVPNVIAEEGGWYSLKQAKRDAENILKQFPEGPFQDEYGRTWKRVVRYYQTTVEELN